jgi:hypothetical protein
MSFYDDASLVFLPSGQAGKDTKAYSIKPTNGDGDFTFSRGSNLTATRVDSNGLIAKGRENLLLQSNQFDTTWTTSNASVTSGQSGYDGSSDAWELEAASTGSSRVQQFVSTSGVNTYSVYAKAGSSGFMIFGTATAAQWYNLTSGTLGAVSGTIVGASIEPVGASGWYRCSMTESVSTIVFQIYLADADANTMVTSGKTIYIQDSQFEQGLVATEYIESGATTGLAGILEDSPRFDYSGGASCPSLLLEPSRTNLVGQSEYIDSWNNYTSGNGAAPTITTNYIESPEGIVNATRLQLETNGTSSTDASGVLQSIALDGSSTYIFSFWIKSNSGSSAELSTFINSSFGVQFTATTEWQRLDFEVVSNSTNPRNFGIVARGNYHQSVDVSFWGAQLEQGSYPTSYIPNHSGGSETRNADECTKTTISGLIGQTEGTIYCEFEYNGAADSGVFNRIIGLGTGVTQNRILLAKNDTTAELVAFAVTGGTTQVFQAIAGTSIIGHHKVAISYKANEYKVYLDGQLKFTDTSASVPATTDVYIGTAEDGTTNNELGGVVKQSIIYKEVLSEDNCKALTTL